MSLNRRHFLQLAAASALTRSMRGQTAVAKATLTLNKTPVATMPLDFTGLSYESPQLANPAFFSAANKELVAIFRELSPTGGVLRTGGNLSAFTGWRDHPATEPGGAYDPPITPTEQAFLDKGKHYWEWDLTDPTLRNGKREAVFTPASIETLAGFLDATGWKLLYGLNFATGTPEQAAAEAACVQRLCGKNVLGFQLGNELDFWVGGFRPKTWDFDSYYAQWKQWVRVIRAKAPNAAMGGPDVAIRLDWMEKLAEDQGKEIAVLTKHHYAMGPAGDPKMDAHHLLGPDPDVAKEIASAQRARAFAGVGFRNSECNSCFHGGQPGVSNAYASALWGADYLLTLAQGGHVGANLHGGGEGIYSPITGNPTQGFTRQPLYYGMRFAQLFSGATLFPVDLDTKTNVTAYAGRRDHDLLLALINKDASPVDIRLDPPHKPVTHLKDVQQLSAPALASRTGVRLEPVPAEQVVSPNGHPGSFRVAPYSALLVRYSEGRA
jgi:hypothetical protein